MKHKSRCRCLEEIRNGLERTQFCFMPCAAQIEEMKAGTTDSEQNIMTDRDKINSILRHIKKVEDNCNLLAHKTYDGNPTWTLELIKRGRMHDLSKLTSYEFKNLWPESDKFRIALAQHRKGNRHHPEYFDHEDDRPNHGIHHMNDLDVAEMVCDCLARAQEFGTDVREWFFGDGDNAPSKYNYKKGDAVWDTIDKYIDLLITSKFK